MKNNISIIKPVGLSTNDFIKYIKKELDFYNIYCLEDLPNDISGVINLYFNKNEINNILLTKNKYLLILEMKEKYINFKKNEFILTEKYIDKKIIDIKIKKNKNNEIEIYLLTKYKFNIEKFMEYLLINFKNIINIKLVKRIENNNIDYNDCLTINDLWKFKNNTYILNYLNKKIKVTNLLIGEFDLIHKGHLKLLKNKNISILTFLNNPSKKDLVSNINYRIKELEKFKPDNIFLFDIKKENISANKFIEKYIKKLSPDHIYVGSDFKFGKNALGDISLLKKYFNIFEIKKDENFSTNKVKSLIKDNNFLEVNSILNKEFHFEGIIVKGKQLGRKLGYPTANIIVNTKFLFNEGSYSCDLFIKKNKYESIFFLRRIDNDNILIEAHIFNFDKNIYGETIKVIPKFFIRKSEKFNNINDLIKNIKKDIDFAKRERNKYGK